MDLRPRPGGRRACAAERAGSGRDDRDDQRRTSLRHDGRALWLEPGESFTVESDQSITAISPPGSGAVDVTVETPLGLSARTPTTSSNTGKTGGRAGTDRRNAEAPRRRRARLGAERQRGAHQGRARSRAVALRCAASGRGAEPRQGALQALGTGLGRCSGKLRLRVRTKLANRRMGTKTIGTAVFSVLAGNRISIKLHLNAAGRAMLAPGRGRLNASLLIVRSSPIATPVAHCERAAETAAPRQAQVGAPPRTPRRAAALLSWRLWR